MRFVWLPSSYDSSRHVARGEKCTGWVPSSDRDGLPAGPRRWSRWRVMRVLVGFVDAVEVPAAHQLVSELAVERLEAGADRYRDMECLVRSAHRIREARSEVAVR